MSIPGLGAAAPVPVSAAQSAFSPPAVHVLEAGSEWRFEVAFGTSISVRVLAGGTAEIFGTELAVNHSYTFTGTKSAIFTWHGCRLEVSGPCEEYIAQDTPMTSYVNTHFALEKLRGEAEAQSRGGPRVLVVGPNHSGKTSLVKMLTAYAVRAGRQPLVINTDSREGMLSIPGSLTATAFGSIVDVEEGWGSSPTSGPSPVPVKLPLVYYYGLPSPEDSPKLYKPVVTRLALQSRFRLKEDAVVRASGCIIDTPGVISQGKAGFDLISHIVSEFEVNTILTLGSERLHVELLKRFSTYRNRNDEPVTLVKLDKSGGCVDRDDGFMTQTREASIKSYFFGDMTRTLSPHTQQVAFAELSIYKIREPSTVSSFLAGGAEEASSITAIFEPVLPSQLMLHCIFAVMHASPHNTHEEIRDACVMGWVYVSEVDEKKKKLKLLAPLNTKVVDKPMVWGSWPEAAVSLIG